MKNDTLFEVKPRKHPHRYERMRGRPDYYKCLLPTCTHYIHKNFLKGKITQCYSCEGMLIIEPEHLKLAKFVCDKCKGKIDPSIEALIKAIGNEEN